MFTRKLTAILLAAIISLMLVPFYAFAENSNTEVSEEVSEESVPETSTPEESTPAEDFTVTVSCGTGGDYKLESTEGSLEGCPLGGICGYIRQECLRGSASDTLG